MPSYAIGSAKQNPETKAVAVRTIFPDTEDFADRQWGVMTVNNGGHYCTNEQVADWPDIQVVPGWNAPEPEVQQNQPVPLPPVQPSTTEEPTSSSSDSGNSSATQ